MDYVYMLTERDADGCGSQITVHAVIGAKLTPEQANLLRRELIDANHRAAENEWQTEETVKSALKAFTEKTGVSAQVCAPADAIDEILY